jgi:hypothetical protein
MEQIKVKDVNVGDYIKATSETEEWGSTYFIVRENDNGILHSRNWIDFDRKGKFKCIDKESIILHSNLNDCDELIFKLTEGEFYNAVGKYIIIGNL